MSKVTQQAMNYAIRSGVAVTASFAIKQSSRLLMHAPRNEDREEFLELQQRLQNKIRIISPAIDMIELIAARGNTSLQSAVTLTKELRWEIQALGQRLANAASSQESAKKSWIGNQAQAKNEAEVKFIIADIKKLLDRLEDSVPLINLAISTSGASLSSSLPSTVSPSRLLQASTFLTACDTEYSMSPGEAVQVGPTFTLSVYMLFGGHIRPQEEEEIRQMTWKEVMHKARVKLRRVPMEVALTSHHHKDSEETTADNGRKSRIPSEGRHAEFAYQMMIVEDLDDDRFHTFDQDSPQPGRYDDVELAGVREVFPIHQISKIFYADTGKVLNIGTEGELNNPFLLLKRDLNAIPPRMSMTEDDTNEEPPASIDSVGDDGLGPDQAQQASDTWRLPPGLDPEWIALEVFTESDDSNDEGSDVEASLSPSRHNTRTDPIDSQLTVKMPNLQIDVKPASPTSLPSSNEQFLTKSSSRLQTKPPPPWVNSIRTSLSLLEMLLRLTSLQQFQQQSHLSISDELLNFFLEESAATGAGGDEMHRQRLRSDARRKVGWDPYNESPVKRRGENYQYQNGYIEDNGSWSPSGLQTRSITGMSDTQSPSPSPSAKGRKEWLKKSEERKGSPLRPSTGRSDEGLGTSPPSALETSGHVHEI